MDKGPIIGLTQNELIDISTRSRNEFKKFYNERRNEYYKNGGRGRFSLRSKEEINEDRRKYLEYLRSKDPNKMKSAIDSYDFKGIIDQDYIKSFREMQKQYEDQRRLYDIFKNYARMNNTKQNPVYCLSWVNWVKEIQEKYNYELKEEYIKYNDDHYAIWGKNEIYILNDYRVYNDKGRWTRIKNKRFAWKAMKRYCKLFFNMEVGSFEKYLWSIMEFCRQTIEINEYFFSPMDVYKEAVNTYYSKSRSEKKCPPLLNKCKKKHKKVYYEKGFEEQAREAYKKKKYIDLENKIIHYVKSNVFNNEIDVDDLMFVEGFFKIVKKDEYEIQLELGVAHAGTTYIELLNKRKISSLINKLIKESPELEGMHIKRKKQDLSKRKKQDTSKRKKQDLSKRKKQDLSKRKKQDLSKRKKQDLSKRKKQDLSKRKKQDRSKWHDLVIEGKTYKEIIEIFPEVKYNAYKQFKHRISKNN